MPDGVPVAAEHGPGDTADADALAADGRLIRRVRWRLVAFSGGTTLLVLVVLGIVLYLSQDEGLHWSDAITVRAAADQPGSRTGMIR